MCSMYGMYQYVGVESELPEDLKEMVGEDNEAFRQEKAEYDARREQERLREVSVYSYVQ